MLDVEQFVYTAASIHGNKGYQIVSKSIGITPEIIAQIEGYFYPVGIDSSDFIESRSLLVFENDMVVYSRIKNIGVGYDGRDNTLYNHSFVFTKNSFQKYGYDSRIFDKFYLEDPSIRGTLPTLSIDPPVLNYDGNFEHLVSILHEVLSSLFMNKKIALFLDDLKFPQDILAILPTSMRLMSFSTCVVDSQKQPKFNFILGTKLKKSILDKNFKIISKNIPPKVSSDALFEKSISYYEQLITSSNFEELQKINNSFNELPSNSNKNKLILLCNYSQFNLASEEKKSEYAENMLKILKEFDGNTFSYYFKKIKKSLKEPVRLHGVSDSSLYPYAALIQLCFILPQKMMIDLFNTVVGSNPKDNDD